MVRTRQALPEKEVLTKPISYATSVRSKSFKQFPVQAPPEFTLGKIARSLLAERWLHNDLEVERISTLRLCGAEQQQSGHDLGFSFVTIGLVLQACTGRPTP